MTKARVAILTNGSVYQFYTDLDAPNKMDEKPFLTLDLEEIDEHIVPEVKNLRSRLLMSSLSLVPQVSSNILIRSKSY